MQTPANNRQIVERKEAVKIGRQIVAANPTYTFYSCPSHVTVTDAARRNPNDPYRHFIVFQARCGQQRRSKEQIAAGVPKVWWIEKQEVA